jgi:protein O-mannosyl-transferase
MKAKKNRGGRAARTSVKPATAAPAARVAYWPYAIGFAVALAAAFEVYGPSLYGPFLFDDQYLPFSLPNFPLGSLRTWMAGVRPVLMLSYWINYQLSGLETYSYHAFNVIFHAVDAALVFLIVRKVLELAQVEGRRREVLAAFAGGVFLLHPANSESVGYVASRSENLSVMFFLGAYAVFLYRRAAGISWGRAACVLCLFIAATLTKEHTVMLPALLLLTDYFWYPPFSLAGIRRNWRLYAPMAAGAGAVGLFLVRVLARAPSAGFGLKDFTWYQYFFTECRAFWYYIRLFLFPTGLRIDYDYPTSRTILEHGAIFGLGAILAAAGAAFYWRRRFPLAAYGFYAFLILMAPTSSFVPIIDPVAERRLYLSMIGLLFIAMELLRRVNVREPKWMAAMAGVLLVAGWATHQRNIVWSDPVVLWEDTVAKSPEKARDEFQLAETYYEKGACQKALEHYARCAQLVSGDHRPLGWDLDTLYIDWGLAYDCLNQPEEALAKFRQAAAMKATAHAYSHIGMIYAKQNKDAEALAALAVAEKLDPNFDITYDYRGRVYLRMGNAAAAVPEFRRALAINPHNQRASEGLAMAEGRLQQR